MSTHEENTSTYSNIGAQKQEINEDIKKNKAIIYIKWLLIIGEFLIFSYSMSIAYLNNANSNWSYFFIIFSQANLMAGMSLSVGSLIGFIFAIPRSISNSEADLIKTSQGYIANDNLVQVGDWLTKTIVGLGLTKLSKIPDYIMSIGVHYGPTLGGGVIGDIFAESIIIFFSISGFILTYLWTRLYFSKLLENR